MKKIIFLMLAALTLNASAQSPILLEACNSIDDKERRLICLKEIPVLNSRNYSNDLKKLKSSFASFASLVKNGISFNIYKSQLVEPKKELGVFISNNPNASPTSIDLLNQSIAAYNDAEKIWRAKIYDTQDGGMFFGEVLNYVNSDLTEIVRKYHLQTTVILMNPHLPAVEAIEKVWAIAADKAKLAFDELEKPDSKILPIN